MPDIDYEQLMQLRELQDLESEIRRIQSEVEKLNDEKNAIGDQLAVCESQCAEQTVAMESLKKEYKRASDEVKEKERLIRKSNEKLMSVKNNREYQALLKEVEELKTSIGLIEDQMLACMEQTDAAQSELKEREKALAEARRRVDSDRVEIAAEQVEKEKRIAEIDARRQIVVARVEAVWMKKFLQIQRLQPDRKPVAKAVNSICTGCHMNIPAQMYNELHRKGEMRYCPFCQRILYYEEEVEA